MSAKLEWIPMESNPEVMTDFIRKLGVKSHIGVVDVLGFDERYLQMIENDVEGLVLCCPLKCQALDFGRLDESAKTRLYFIRQTIRNACATMALIHVLANRCRDEDFEPQSGIQRFISESQQLKPERKATKLEACKIIATAHEDSSVAGETEAPAASEFVEYHFTAFICSNETIYELDGRKRGPIDHGQSSDRTFLKDAMGVIKRKLAAARIDLTSAEPDFSIQAVTRARL